MNIAFIGDLTVDTYPALHTMKLGGSSLNSALCAKKLQATPSILAAVGSDEAGSEFRKKMQKEGINDSLVTTLPGATSSIDIFVDKTGEHTFGTWNPGVLTTYDLGDSERVFLAGQHASHLILYGPTTHLLSSYAPIAHHLGDTHLSSVDFGDFTQFNNDLTLVEKAAEVADILFFGLTEGKDAALIATLKDLAPRVRATIVVTLAEHGSLACVQKTIYRQKADHVAVVNTTGAGDAYIVGFLLTYLQTKDIQQSMKHGTSIATQTITQPPSHHT